MVSRVLKIVGFIGGAAALLWAMRDRFVSVAIPREPNPPTFARGVVSTLGVQSIPGIGPVTARKLSEADIRSVADLAGADHAEVAEAAGVSPSRAAEWVSAAIAQGRQAIDSD